MADSNEIADLLQQTKALPWEGPHYYITTREKYYNATGMLGLAFGKLTAKGGCLEGERLALCGVQRDEKVFGQVAETDGVLALTGSINEVACPMCLLIIKEGYAGD